MDEVTMNLAMQLLDQRVERKREAARELSSADAARINSLLKKILTPLGELRGTLEYLPPRFKAEFAPDIILIDALFKRYEQIDGLNPVLNDLQARGTWTQSKTS